ncbi:MAG: tail fiber protein [Pseudomonadota bacterium]
MKTLKYLALTGLFATSTAAVAEMKDKDLTLYVGQVILVGSNFCPAGTLEANGQILSVSDYSSLFSLYGTAYGGDGRSTFGLPDLRGRAPVGNGEGVGLEPVARGQQYGNPVDVEKSTQKGNSVSLGTPRLGMRYCVAFEGIFPSRGS